SILHQSVHQLKDLAGLSRVSTSRIGLREHGPSLLVRHEGASCSSHSKFEVLARRREIREVRTRVTTGVRDIAISSGCSEAWYRAWFGTRRPWVQIPPARCDKLPQSGRRGNRPWVQIPPDRFRYRNFEARISKSETNLQFKCSKIASAKGISNFSAQP